ncbi:TM2 domain-containing protein [Candidatus Persebacteraceae bacterium Df01]|jgi:TM2 domain-containing membrane protein YozV|uniref:TM2 domain-containing protein n=1 Tax=Candidatus Doriopsillibacter californiensis TaxID=2970740 RepID=A0ABT7QN57_9GAMM|nr:TM2 domain-containing protein [Candidatus Persebacteraceae bacterium Df01]
MKTTFKAYMMALVGILLGIVGLHRFYLGMNFTGALMLLLFVGGVAFFAIGYAHLLTPLLQQLSVSNGDFTQLPPNGLFDEETKGWFVGGGLLIAASLCWLAVDLILMPSLTTQANRHQSN